MTITRVSKTLCGFALFTAAAFAQTTIVEATDATGRHPYAWSNGGSAYNNSSVSVPFQSVPDRNRMVAEHVSAIVYLSDAALVTCRLVGKSGHHTLMAVPMSAPAGSYRYHVISQSISLVFDAGDTPRVVCQTLPAGKIVAEIHVETSLTGRLMPPQ